MDLQSLQRSVAEVLRDLVPRGVSVRSSEWGIVVATPQGSRSLLFFARNIALNMQDGHEFEEALSSATEALLSRVQDLVTVTTAEPWPNDRCTDRFAFAVPTGVVDDGRLGLWFEDRAGQPVTARVWVRVDPPSPGDLEAELSRGEVPMDELDERLALRLTQTVIIGDDSGT